MAPSGIPPANRLNLGDAIHDGWTAFCRAPWSFVLFALLLTGLQILLLPLQLPVLRQPRGEGISSVDFWLSLIGLSFSLVVSCWGNVGMVRGAWLALEGQRPSLGSLLRWDGRGFARVLKAWLALASVLSIPLLAIGLVLALAALVLWLLERAGFQLSDSNLLVPGVLLALLVALLLGLMLLAVLYFSVNQQFLAQVALLEKRAPMESVQRGRRLSDPHWILLLLLLFIKSILILVGILLSVLLPLGLGLMVAWPVVSCISTAAFRQLAGQRPDPAVLSPGSLY